MNVQVVHGKVETMLRSGSDVRVKSGTAQIALIEGGVIKICGPAHLSVLKTAGALTVALESGTIHAHIAHDMLLTVYTAQIMAQPIAIGDAPQDMLVGFDNPGTMCIRSTRGAIRIEQQLTGQSVVIPQTGDVLLLNAQLDSLRTSSGLCKCELQITDAPADPTGRISRARPSFSRLATTEDVRKKSFDAKPELPATPPPAKSADDEGPIYQVIVPPLVYIANVQSPAGDRSLHDHSGAPRPRASHGNFPGPRPRRGRRCRNHRSECRAHSVRGECRSPARRPKRPRPQTHRPLLR